MKVKELMERTGAKRFNQTKAWIEDALVETQMFIDENVVRSAAPLKANQRVYSLPNNLIQLKNVKITSGDKKWEAIERIAHPEGIEDAT